MKRFYFYFLLIFALTSCRREVVEPVNDDWALQLEQEAESFFTHGADCDTMIEAVIWDLRCRNDTSGFVHNFIEDKGIAYWDAGIVILDDNSRFSLLVPVVSTSNLFSGFIGADNSLGSLRVGFIPFSKQTKESDDVIFIANYFRSKLSLSDADPELTFVEIDPIATKYWDAVGDWCVDMYINEVYKGTTCKSENDFLKINEVWHPIDEPTGGYDDDDGHGGGGGSGGGGGGTTGNPLTPPEDPENPDNNKKPCNDAATGKANPLTKMQICETPGQGIKGGLFNALRESGTPHRGVDLAGEIGTPIYAAFGGEIITYRGCFDPNVPWSEYVSEYPNEDPANRAAGNMISIKTTINGVVIIVKYMHLNVVDTKLGYGKSVSPGQCIGTLGQTGSAGSKTGSGGPHLHIEFRKDWKLGTAQDPNIFLYSTFDVNGKGSDC